MNDSLRVFVEKQKEFLGFLKTRYNIFHESNVFFRDLHYGVMGFLQMNSLPSRYSSAEELTRQVIATYESMNVLVRIDERSWMLNYPLFKKVPVKAVVPARSAAPAAKPTALIPTATAQASQQNAVTPPPAIHNQMVG
jgi:hypothetical protein